MSALDETQEQALCRRFATEYQLITRRERLRRIAADLVRHFVGRGFLGKAMVVSIDKATAIRMYDLVAHEWQRHLAELEERAARLPGVRAHGGGPADRLHARDRHVFRHLEAALTIYAAGRPDDGGEPVIRDKAALVGELEEEIAELVEYCDRWDVDLDALARAEGFEFIALRDASMEALVVDDVTRAHGPHRGAPRPRLAPQGADPRGRARLVKAILDELPDAYDLATWEHKADIVFNHIFASFHDDGRSVYDEPEEEAAQHATSTAVAPAPVVDVDAVSTSVLERIRTDAAFAELVAEQLRGDRAFFAVPSEELIAADETYEVEFKSTARWNVCDGRKDKRMEDAVGQDDRRLPQRRRRHAVHRCRRRAHADRPRRRPPSRQAAQRRRAGQLAHHPSHRGTAPHPGDVHAHPHRADKRPPDLPRRRRPVLLTRLRAYERQAGGLLGAVEQQHPSAAGDRDRGLRSRTLAVEPDRPLDRLTR